MIKINLLKNFGHAPAQQSIFSKISLPMGRGTSSSHVELGGSRIPLKIVLLLLPVIAFYGVEKYLESNKESDLDKLKADISKRSGEVNKFKPEIEAMKRFKIEKEQLQIRIDTIKQLSKARLQNVKALDALHDIIPKKAWLTEFKINKTDVSLEGFAKEDRVVIEFMENLKNSIFFENIELKKTVEVKNNNLNVKSFTITCNLGKM